MSHWVARLTLLAVALLLTPVLSPYQLGVLALVVIYAIAALAQNLLAGYADVPSLGNVIFFAAGAYVTAVLLGTVHLPLWAAAPLAVLAAGGIGLAVGLPALRITGMHLAIASVALVFVAQDLMTQWDTTHPADSGGVTVNAPSWLLQERGLYIAAVIVAAALYFGAWRSMRSRIGHTVLATTDSPIAAAAAGINVLGVRLGAFVVTGAVTGLAGVLYLYYARTVTPTVFPLDLSLAFLTMMILGGSRTIGGSLLGALIIGLLPQALSYLPGTVAGIDVQQSVAGIDAVLLLVTLRFAPDGLWPALERLAARIRPDPQAESRPESP